MGMNTEYVIVREELKGLARASEAELLTF